jgi:alpha-glucosidase
MGLTLKAGVNTETYKHYIDFAAEYGLEYIILDEGWYKLGDLMAVVSEVDMDELASYAKEKGVGLVMWVDMENPG